MDEMQSAGEPRWCRRCGQRVRLEGPADMIEQYLKAVHAVSGRWAAAGMECGYDGHLAAPVNLEPPLWAAARRIRRRYGGVFDVGARFGILRADYANPPPGVTMPHHTAVGEDAEAEMIAKLDAAVAAMPAQRKQAALAGATR